MFIEIGYLLTDYLGFGYTISTYQFENRDYLRIVFFFMVVIYR